jgi:hypothetical protein
VRRSVVAPLALLLPLAACRFDFEPVGHGALPEDATPVDTPPPLPVLPCATPPQFPVPAPAGTGSPVTLSALGAAATATGYHVLAVDSAGDVHGFSFAFDGAALAPRTTNAAVFSGASGAVAAIDTPDGVLAAIEYGRPDPTGTTLVPLDAQLAAHGAPQMLAARYSLDGAIAHGPDGTLAFLGAQASGGAEARLVSSAGTGLGAAHQVIDPSEGISGATLTPAGSGYLVTWTSTPPSPNQVRAEVLDAQLLVTVPPTTINPGAMFNGDNPRAGYAATVDRFLFAWSIKTSSGDELWVSLRDNLLTELHAIRLSTHGVLPRVVGGKADFLVAWKDTNTSSGLAAARVRFDGSIVPLVVSGKGGSALGWDLTTRAGQPVLVWIEGATAPGMWLDPLCN